MDNLTIKEWREVRDLNQLEVANHIGINIGEYVAKEEGKRKWMVRDLIRLCKLFNIKITQITI